MDVAGADEDDGESEVVFVIDDFSVGVAVDLAVAVGFALGVGSAVGVDVSVGASAEDFDATAAVDAGFGEDPELAFELTDADASDDAERLDSVLLFRSEFADALNAFVLVALFALD